VFLFYYINKIMSYNNVSSEYPTLLPLVETHKWSSIEDASTFLSDMVKGDCWGVYIRRMCKQGPGKICIFNTYKLYSEYVKEGGNGGVRGLYESSNPQHLFEADDVRKKIMNNEINLLDLLKDGDTLHVLFGGGDPFRFMIF